MTITREFYKQVWDKGDYRRGSTAQRYVPFLTKFIPPGSTINDYGSGTGRAEIELLKLGYKVNMVDFCENALEEPTRMLIGNNLTYTVSPLEKLPDDFPVAEWGICINVLMTVDPAKLDEIMSEMRRTCHNLIIEVYERTDLRLGVEMTTVKGNEEFWAKEMKKHWPLVETAPSPQNAARYVVIGRER